MLEVDNPAKLPPPTEIDYIEEPYVKATTIVPKDLLVLLWSYLQDKRGEYQSMEYLDENTCIRCISLTIERNHL
ncbi:MAG: hypothetical protein ACLRZ2_07800 [Veillonella sp.]